MALPELGEATAGGSWRLEAETDLPTKSSHETNGTDKPKERRQRKDRNNSTLGSGDELLRVTSCLTEGMQPLEYTSIIKSENRRHAVSVTVRPWDNSFLLHLFQPRVSSIKHPDCDQCGSYRIFRICALGE